MNSTKGITILQFEESLWHPAYNSFGILLNLNSTEETIIIQSKEYLMLFIYYILEFFEGNEIACIHFILNFILRDSRICTS